MQHIFSFGGINFIFIAIAVSMVVSAFRSGGRREQRLAQPGPVLLEDPRVPQLQAELDELRQQVDRLTAAETFYAQLQAPAPKPPVAN